MKSIGDVIDVIGGGGLEVKVNYVMLVGGPGW